jgi:TATA-box binding protein (TBP) (component of TFIID and TFIIIB)
MTLSIKKVVKPVIDIPVETIDFSATKYRISTITVTGSINSEVYLDKFYAMLSTHTPPEVSYVEYGANKHEIQSVGIKNTKLKKRKVKDGVEKEKKRFDNQLTIVMFHLENRYNIKLFKNGNVQITGVKDIEKGKNTVDVLIGIVKNIYEKYDKGILKDMSTVNNCNYRIRLINSDFKVNFEIRLDYLFKIVTDKYKIICSYEPCIYPGAKIEYYYPHGGYCKCSTFCNGKSDTCKKITIAVFQSGCVIITGANTIDHINVAYAFICNVLKDNLCKIQRKKLPLPMKKTVIK